MSRPTLRSWILVGAALTGGGAGPSIRCAQEPTASVPTEPTTTADIEGLRRRIAAVLGAHGVPGAAVALVDRRGTIWAGGVGRTDLGGGTVDADTLFRVGSVTKSFLALAVMKLVEAGRLSLEARLRDVAPEVGFGNAWESSQPIRIAHLLEHTAGFDEMRFNEIFASDGREDRPLGEVLAVNPGSRVARWPPGTRFAYSQPGYTMIAYVIEKVGGMPYQRFVEEQVFRPLGIRSACLRLMPEARARLATGHERSLPIPYRPVLHAPAVNLMISARDLARLVALQLGRGELDGERFLSRASIERMEHSATLAYGPASVSYGLANWGDVSQPVPMRGHGGFMPGYQAAYRYSEERGIGYLVLVNDSTTRDVVRAVSDLLLTQLLAGSPPPPPPTRPCLPAELARDVGYYRFASPPVEFRRYYTDVYGGLAVLQGEGGLLLREAGRASVPLVCTGPGLFPPPRPERQQHRVHARGRRPSRGGGRRALLRGGQRHVGRASPICSRRRSPPAGDRPSRYRHGSRPTRRAAPRGAVNPAVPRGAVPARRMGCVPVRAGLRPARRMQPRQPLRVRPELGLRNRSARGV